MREKGYKLSDEQKAAMKAGRNASKTGESIQNNAILTEEQKQTVKLAQEHVPSAVRVFINAFQGSKAAAIKANCIQCSGWEKVGVRDCEIKGCVFWKMRPYQRGIEVEDATNEVL